MTGTGTFGAEPPERVCRTCGATSHTWSETCPQCGANVFDRPPRLSRGQRLLAIAGAVLLLAAGAVVAVLVLRDSADSRDARDARARAVAVRTERAMLVRVQRPRTGGAPALAPPAGASDARILAARRALVERVRADVLRDARARARTGEIEGPVRKVVCAPLQRTSVGAQDVSVGDERDLTRRFGRYDCVAAKRDVVQTGQVVGTFGYPFVAAVDFRRFTYVWCRDGAMAPGERGQALVLVRLSRACLAAHGPPFGNGYLRTAQDR